MYMYNVYTQYIIFIFIEVEPHLTEQMQVCPVHHDPQRRIAHTQFAGNADQGLFHSSSIQLYCVSL
jgi:hypothetical protein